MSKTIEEVRKELDLFITRNGKAKNVDWPSVYLVVDALDDIISGRMCSNQVSALDVIALKEAASV